MRKLLCVSVAVLVMVGCAKKAEETPAQAEPVAAAEEPVSETADARLDRVLAAQPDDEKARYQYRHPKETLQFFGI